MQVLVIGAGVIGLAVARTAALAGHEVTVAEMTGGIANGVSSRNSEVIHAGLYYPTDSLRARLCVAGRRALYAFLEAHQVAYRKCGKLVVAAEPDEVPRLAAIAHQARLNGVEGLETLTGAQAAALEPGLRCVGAILSPESGVFDSHGYMLALRGEIEGLGGDVVLGTPFEGASAMADG